MELTCESLGIKPEDIEEKIISRVVENLLGAPYMDEDGYEGVEDSKYMKNLKELVQARIDSKVSEIADKHILPNVDSYIETLTIQKTNQWGEAKGKSVTFIEYLIQQAEQYMVEPVNFKGKTKAEDSYSWSKNTTRIAYMIDSHLQYSISTAMKKAMETANESIVGGIKSAVGIQLSQIIGKLKVSATV